MSREDIPTILRKFKYANRPLESVITDLHQVLKQPTVNIQQSTKEALAEILLDYKWKHVGLEKTVKMLENKIDIANFNVDLDVLNFFRT